MNEKRYGDLKSVKLWFECKQYARDTSIDLKNLIKDEGLSTSTKEILIDLKRIIDKAIEKEFSTVIFERER
ncbi:MAG: hypothetical protein ACOC5T_01930 [Elusimicrobiota bacterium]